MRSSTSSLRSWAAQRSSGIAGAHKDDAELSEYLVRVEWLRDVPLKQAYWETGLFALQHTACRMTSRFTIERLTAHFGLEDA